MLRSSPQGRLHELCTTWQQVSFRDVTAIGYVGEMKIVKPQRMDVPG